MKWDKYIYIFHIIIVNLLLACTILTKYLIFWKFQIVTPVGSEPNSLSYLASEPTSLTGVRFAYTAIEQALPHIVEEVRI